jgi:hypothetical protein
MIYPVWFTVSRAYTVYHGFKLHSAFFTAYGLHHEVYTVYG